MHNPLLEQGALPTFSTIQPKNIEPAIKQIIAENKAELAKLLVANQHYTWENLLAPLDEMGDKLMKAWSPVSHLHAVMQNEELRAAYNVCQPLMTEYHTDMLQNETLYQAIQSVANSPEYHQLTDAQRKVIENDLRDFKLAGVHLTPAEKIKFAEYQKQLNKLMTQFSDNLLDATQAWVLHITDAALLKGLPDENMRMAKQNAEQRKQEGWVFTLEFPSYSAVMKYLKNRDLRRTMYEAYVTRASDQGPNAGQWDNTKIMQDILTIRHAMAELLGFQNYAEYSLFTKMAEKPDVVLDFLYDLVEKSKAMALKEVEELTEFAKKLDSIAQLEAWDYAYYTEKLRLEKFDISEEELRQYFSMEKVLAGMFSVVNKLYGITIQELKGKDTWHPQVQVFSVHDEKNNLRGYFYTDFYSRANKRGGAWMDEIRVRRYLSDGTLQYPAAYLTCNFTRPLEGETAYLNHDEEVLTLFHEFGHCLHHILTQVDYPGVSGINGVLWDAVEFPSQIMEYWCWEPETFALISEHKETKATLPKALYEKMLHAKNFQSAMHMLRQLEFSLFDFQLHLEKNASVEKTLNEIRKEVAVVKTPVFNRFAHSFTHIFSGSYAAGYYSYKWAEVLASDAFAKFEEDGIFNKETGRAYLKNILEQGGVYPPMQLFIAFRGRRPSIDALLRHSGLAFSS